MIGKVNLKKPIISGMTDRPLQPYGDEIIGVISRLGLFLDSLAVTLRPWPWVPETPRVHQ